MNPTKSVTEVNGFLDRTSRKEDEGSKQLDELAELGHSLSQSLTLERGEQFFGCLRRVAKTLSLSFDSSADLIGSHVQ
jgi:hypothetical protein